MLERENRQIHKSEGQLHHMLHVMWRLKKKQVDAGGDLFLKINENFFYIRIFSK